MRIGCKDSFVITPFASFIGVQGPVPAIAGINVMLDGDIAKGVIAADTKEGWVKRYKEDAEGAYILQGKRVLIEVCFGKVEILLRLNEGDIEVIGAAAPDNATRKIPQVRAHPDDVDIGKDSENVEQPRLGQPTEPGKP